MKWDGTLGDVLGFKSKRIKPKRPVKWCGETKCNFCGTEESPFFYDAKTKVGPWAFMCSGCWLVAGIGRLGTGYGQKYDGKTLEKVEG